MKKFIFSTFMFFTLNFAICQNYMFSFSASGASSTLDSVNIENLDSGIKLTITGSDTLHLLANVGIQSDITYSPFLKITPNPFVENCIVEFNSSVNNLSQINIYDISGRVITGGSYQVLRGINRFEIKGLQKGMFLLSLKSGNQLYLSKLISNNPTKSSSLVTIKSNFLLTKNESSSEKNISFMEYHTGERLLFTGYSGNLSGIIVLIPAQDENINFILYSCIDNEGSSYPTVKIGEQVWMQSNLYVKRYNNGDIIETTDALTDLSGIETPKYQWLYDNNSDYEKTYGRLYTWYTVTDDRGICPVGWHIPSDSEWTVLTDFLQGTASAGGQLKENSDNYWNSPNTGATNSTGFSAVPAGSRYYSGGFYDLGLYLTFWLSTSYDNDFAIYRTLYYNSSEVGFSANAKKHGFSVRCLKDN